MQFSKHSRNAQKMNNSWTHPTCLCVLACALFFHSTRVRSGETVEKPLFTILFTAESHAALLPCDCPLQPLGGVARRATLIAQYRKRGPVLLLDGGGFAAGGIYDEDSNGDPERDKLRTRRMCEAMRLMKYDAVVLGPAEAYMFKSGGDAPAPILCNVPHVIEFEGQKVKVIGMSEPELKLASIASVEAEPKTNDTLEIVVSRLGEESSAEIASLGKMHLALCAGRKSSQRDSWKVGASTLINFDYQARNLIVIEVFPSKSPTTRFDFVVRQEPLDRSVPDDPEIAALLAPHMQALKEKGKRVIDIEYWMMPDCPGCKLSRPEVEALQKNLEGRARIVPHWVVELQDDKLSSLHGDAELNEARTQILIEKYYPEKIWPWLDWRAKNPSAPWESGAAALDILPARIRQSLDANEADPLLRAEFTLAERRHIRATPSLIVSNRAYDGTLDRAHLLGALCAALDSPKPAACKDAPACFSDSECRQRGFNARCADAGTPQARCDFTPAKKIPALVLFDELALASSHERIMEALLADLPGIDFTLVKFSSPSGVDLARQAKVSRLPAFFLDPGAATEKGFQSTLKGIAREVTVRLDDADRHWLLLREDRNGVGANRIAARERTKGRADLFVSRFSKNGEEALETALDCAASPEAVGLKLELHDVLYWKTTGSAGQPQQLAAPNGIAELEEAARASAVRLSAPERLAAYLRERGNKRGSSYWDVALKKAGLNTEKIRALAEEPSAEVLRALEADATFLKNLDAGGDIVLLAENCELIPIASRKDLKHILERIAARK